jgi:Outer spore coat protein E (CotE).
VASFREIVTKAVIGKGKKTFTNHYSLVPTETPSTILGCWVINHQFSGSKNNDNIAVEGKCDINIWYSFENDTKTMVATQSINYYELCKISRRKETNISSEEEIIVRSLKQPACTKVEIKDGKIEYAIEKELGIEIVGDTKVRITVDENEDDWDEIKDVKEEEKIMNQIEKEVEEKFITDENKSN